MIDKLVNLTLLHSEMPKLYTILAFLSAIELHVICNQSSTDSCSWQSNCDKFVPTHAFCSLFGPFGHLLQTFAFLCQGSCYLYQEKLLKFIPYHGYVRLTVAKFFLLS